MNIGVPMVDLEISSLPLESQQRIDAICRNYESNVESVAGADPLSLLDKVSDRERPVLLYELVRLHEELVPASDLSLRVSRQFPEYVWVIDHARSAGLRKGESPDETLDSNWKTRQLTCSLDGQTDSFQVEVPGQYIVGSSADADISLPNSDLSARHACLILEADRLLVVSLEKNNSPPSTHSYGYTESFHCNNVQFGFHAAGTPSPNNSAKTSPGSGHITSKIELEIDGFEIVREIGQGSFGVVYAAIQKGTHQKYAIKSLLPEAAKSERLQTLFMREISVVSQLRHPNIVSYHGFGVAEQPYLILELVSHHDIDDIIDRQPEHKRVRLCIGIVRKVLSALSHAHELGIIHRDIKPGNVLAGIEQGKLFVKLTDFGLSKFYETAGYSGITASDAMCGTIAYMSPEQLTNSKYAEPDCDVYAAAVLLYRLLTKHIPHESESPAEIVQGRMSRGPIPIDQHVSQIPAELAALVQRALHPDRNMRFRTADEFSRELKSFGL